MLFGTAKMNRENHLEIGGCDTVKLAKIRDAVICL